MSAAEKWKTVSSVQSFFSSLLLGIVSNLLCIIKSNLCILLPAIHMIKKKESVQVLDTFYTGEFTVHGVRKQE